MIKVAEKQKIFISLLLTRQQKLITPLVGEVCCTFMLNEYHDVQSFSHNSGLGDLK